MSIDKLRVNQLLENCKSSSSSKILRSLLIIRNDVIRSGWGIQILRECGGVELLVSLLKHSKEDILELALSTLGNCCMDEQTSLAVGELKICPHLVNIIKSLANDKLVGRACRLLGNLAQQKTNAQQLLQDGAVPPLMAIISNTDQNASVQTLSMAVRAVRLLWLNGDQQDEMLSSGAVRSVSVLLCKECERLGLIGESTGAANMKREKDREHLLKGILKCLGYFTMLAHHKCAEQILGEGGGYRCLVALCQGYQDLASKCLVNLCYMGPCRPVLGTAGAVECLVELTRKQADYPECYLNAICLLCREAVNRAKLRQCGGLSVLLDAVRNTGQLSRHTTALRALLQFVFDDLSFQILIEEGLISIIEDQLKDYVSSMRCEHQVPTKDPEECGHSSTDAAPQEEGCRIEIERDNMIIGFNDEFTLSDDEGRVSECEQSDGGKKLVVQGKKRSRKPEDDKNTGIQKMAKYDWSSNGISWEPKPDCSLTLSNLSPLSGYSPTNSGCRSPENVVRSSGHVYARMSSRLDEERSNDCSPSNEGCSYYNSGQWSPGSSNSLCYSSPYDEDTSDSEKSERYSPVCSDVDEERDLDRRREGHKNAVTGEMDDLMLDDETLSIKELQLEETSSSSHQSKSHRVRCLLVLLSRASHCDSAIECLASPRLLMALLAYIQNARNPANRGARILARIISHATHIIKILKLRLVLHLYKMRDEPRHGDCKQCSQLKVLCTRLMTQLTMLAESDYGIGEISYQLQKGEVRTKHSLALTLPYIIKAHRPLKRYLISCKAFDFLFGMITSNKEPLEHLVPSVSQLAQTLHIKDPKILENMFQDQSAASYHPNLQHLEPSDVIHFVLDDTSHVRAEKSFLCQQSDVFNAMFTGAFKESNQSSVKLKSVTKDSLEYLLALLYCGANNEDSAMEVFPLVKNLSTALEALLLADKFLMERIKRLLFSALVQFKLTHETAGEMYVWSLEEGMGLLCVETVAYILTGDMSTRDRIHVVNHIMSTPYRQQLLDDIKTIIVRHFK